MKTLNAKKAQLKSISVTSLERREAPIQFISQGGTWDTDGETLAFPSIEGLEAPPEFMAAQFTSPANGCAGAFVSGDDCF